MGSPPTRQRLLLDKRRRKTRQQVMRLAVIAAMLLILLGLLLAAVLAIVALARRADGQEQAATSEPSAPRRERRPRPELGLARSFKPAPWFIAADSNRLYAALDNGKQEVDSGGFPLDTLQAYSLVDKKLVWEAKLAGRYSHVDLAGNTLVTLSENLGEYTGFELQAYDAATGESLWPALKSPQGEDVHIACDSDVVSIGYRALDSTAKDSGYRLEAYKALTGKKLWGPLSRKMTGLRQGDAEALASLSSFELAAYEDLLVYQLYNVAGVIDTNTGRVLSEYTAEGYIHDVQVDPNTRSAYALCAGSKADTAFLVWMPLGKEKPESLCRIENSGEQALLLLDRGHILVAYPAAGVEGVPTTKLIGYRYVDLKNKKKKASFNYKFEAGLPADLAPLPETPGEFLLALNEGSDESGAARGPSSLRRISLVGEPTVWETARQRQAVQMLAPFKLDCLVLLAGGEVKLYNPAADSIKRLRNMAFPELGAVHSANRASLALTAYPAEYVEGRIGLPMQIQVWH